MDADTLKGIKHSIYGAGIDTFAMFGNIAIKVMIFCCGDLCKILLTDVC